MKMKNRNNLNHKTWTGSCTLVASTFCDCGRQLALETDYHRKAELLILFNEAPEHSGTFQVGVFHWQEKVNFRLLVQGPESWNI